MKTKHFDKPSRRAKPTAHLASEVEKMPKSESGVTTLQDPKLNLEQPQTYKQASTDSFE